MFPSDEEKYFWNVKLEEDSMAIRVSLLCVHLPNVSL